MNLIKLKKILKEVLILSCNTEQIAYLGRETDSRFDLKQVSGFGNHVVIPKQIAAETIVNYFSSEQEILNFIATLFSYEGKGISGGIVTLKEKQKLDKFLYENNIKYESSLNKFIILKRDQKAEDWGFLENSREYKLAFISLDIIGSSELIKTNVRLDIESTLKNFKNFIKEHTEKHNGRIWKWEGDGGLLVFLEEMGVSNAVRCSLEILYSLPIFNLTKNFLRWENLIPIRLAIHFGRAIFFENISLIESDDINITKAIEHSLGIPNSILITDTAYILSQPELRRFFEDYTTFRNLKIYKLKNL
ncbi:MAG: hypothetical protein ACK4UJ_09455 [Leptonema sp. (in: bacteria)]